MPVIPIDKPGAHRLPAIAALCAAVLFAIAPCGPAQATLLWGFSYTGPAGSDYSYSDNLLYPDEPLLDVFGFSYTTLSTGSYNVFHDTVLPPGCGSAAYAEIPGPDYTCNGSNGVDLTAFDVTFAGEVPEPGSMALLASALAGLGLIRRRKAA